MRSDDEQTADRTGDRTGDLTSDRTSEATLAYWARMQALRDELDGLRPAG